MRLIFFLFFIGLPNTMPYKAYSLNQFVPHAGYALIQRLNPLAPRCSGEPSVARISPSHLTNVPFVTIGLLFKTLE